MSSEEPKNSAIKGAQRPRLEAIRSQSKVHFATPQSESPFKRTYKKTPMTKRPEVVRGQVMRERLSAWLESKGRTPSRFKNLMCFHKSLQSAEGTVAGGLSVNELDLQQRQLELEQTKSTSVPFNTESHSLSSLLSECSLLLQSGCPVDNVRAWVEEIKRLIPNVCKEAKYYILQSEIAELTDVSNADIINIFEVAVRNDASPADEIATALTNFVSRMNCRKNNLQVTPKKSRQSVNKENRIGSSCVKYSLSETNPFIERLRSSGLPTPYGIVTPVRRSARLSKTPRPSAFQDHSKVLDTLDDLSPNSKDHLLFQPNRALSEEFEDASDTLF